MADLQELYHKLDRIIELLEALVGYEPKVEFQVTEPVEFSPKDIVCTCDDMHNTARMQCPYHG